jgi:hypothetical protein
MMESISSTMLLFTSPLLTNENTRPVGCGQEVVKVAIYICLVPSSNILALLS